MQTKESPFQKQVDFMKNKHGQQRRKGYERLYYWHPLEVAHLIHIHNGTDDQYVAALFHDLLEDTDTTEAEILAMSNERVLEMVKVLTKDKSLPDEVYVEAVMKDPEIRDIKFADRISNLRDSTYTNKALRKKYVVATECHYLPHIWGSTFENRFIATLGDIKEMVQMEEENL